MNNQEKVNLMNNQKKLKVIKNYKSKKRMLNKNVNQIEKMHKLQVQYMIE